MTKGLRIAALAALLAAEAACQSAGIPAAEIPEEPIALVYRPPELARRRAEFLEDDAAKPPPREGVAHVDDISRYVAGMFGARGRLGVPARFAGQLALLDPRTGEVRPVESARRGAIPLEWSTDRSRLLFTQPVGGRMQIFELELASGEMLQLTRGPTAHPRGCYGPEGRLVAMELKAPVEPLESRIVLLDRQGGTPEPVSLSSVASSPACAPDGSAIAWVAEREGGGERIVVQSPALTGNPRVLAPGREPAFSPDGQWIAFSAPTGNQWRLWRIRPDGTGRAPIGRGVLDEHGPTVSPDGRLVVYVTELEHRPHLYLRRLDGSGDRIFFADGDAEHPVW
jgi:Tol biopolymer transport system component